MSCLDDEVTLQVRNLVTPNLVHFDELYQDILQGVIRLNTSRDFLSPSVSVSASEVKGRVSTLQRVDTIAITPGHSEFLQNKTQQSRWELCTQLPMTVRKMLALE